MDIQYYACISTGGMVQVAKWGNSLAVRLPANVVDALGLKEGDDIEIYADQAGAFSVSKKPTAVERIERLRRYRGRLPADFRFDRESLSDRGNAE